MKKRLIAFAILIALLAGLAPLNVKADTGPKPTTTVKFTGFGDVECYGTLLSSNASSAMWQAFDGDPDELTQMPDMAAYNCDCSFEIWKAFVKYQDEDGYYFLQRVWKVSGDSDIYWNYFAPSSFKVLLYFPATDTFVVSKRTEKNAFNSYYEVNKAGVMKVLSEEGTTVDEDGGFEMDTKYEFSEIVIGVLLRFVTTLVIEMLLALLFKFRSKYQLLVILTVNFGTQMFLNLVLAIREYQQGQGWDYYGLYIGLEVLILLIEAVAYLIFLNRKSENERKKSVIVAYTIVANLLSFLAGTLIIIPFF